jgi:type IV pilus biogenesis protein PilP
MADNRQNMSASSRQKVIVLVLVIVIAIILWQVVGLFRTHSTPVAPAPTKATVNVQTVTPKQLLPPQAQTKPVAPLSPREVEMQRMQQEAQAKYLAALNELQMLRLNQSIAEANRAIMTAKLATVTAEKGIVDLLAPPTQVTTNTYAQGLVSPTSSSPTNVPPPIVTTDVKYTVISVTLLQSKWSAVIGYSGNLYHVSVGDILPPDGSTVVSISKSGVTLQKDGVRRRISLVPII